MKTTGENSGDRSHTNFTHHICVYPTYIFRVVFRLYEKKNNQNTIENSAGPERTDGNKEKEKKHTS